MEQNGWAAILADRKLAGVAPEMNLWQVQMRLATLALKPRGDIIIGSKQGYQWRHKKEFCPPK